MLCRGNTFSSGCGYRCVRTRLAPGCATRDVACASSGQAGRESPLESLPPSLANKFRRAQKKREERSQEERPTQQLHAQQTSASTGSSRPARTLADVWTVGSSESAIQPKSVAADSGLREQLQNLVPSHLSENSHTADKDPQSGDGSPKSFLDSIRSNGPVVSNPESSAASSNARTSDEEIRATRQQRMQQQGLDGSGSTGWRTGDGSDGELTEADNFSELLRPVQDSSDTSSTAASEEQVNLSAEQFTLRKEERERERGANVISTDTSYKPSVGTWGIYPRPKDISKAYGGGRNITPADSAISAEEQAEFDASLNEQLASFRRSAGLEVDPAVEVECERLTEQGTILLNRGNLTAALVIFDEAADLLSCKTNAGGTAHLQKAITLDSLGRSDEALKIYRQLQGHRCLDVAKTAKTMSFGFKAGEFLNASSISYAAKKEEYDPFFTSLGGKWGWDTVYVASEEEKKAEKQVNALLVAATTLLVFAPLGAFYYYWYYSC